MDNEASQQPKQERSRTRWTPCLDRVFADLVVKQIQLGNRQNSVFDKKTWNNIRDEFNKQTELNFNNNQLRKHLDVLRLRYNMLRSSHLQNVFALEDTCIGFDLWEDFGVRQRPEPIKVKDCPIYEQLCTIFADDSIDGKYAQSSHFEGLEVSNANQAHSFPTSPEDGTMKQDNPSTSSKLGQGNALLSEKDSQSFSDRKRKRQSDTTLVESRMDPETIEKMADALFDMAAAVRSRIAKGMKKGTKTDDKFSITNCIRALDEIENVDEGINFAALDLFENSSFRETFLSLKGDKIRLAWLQGKCRKLSSLVT